MPESNNCLYCRAKRGDILPCTSGNFCSHGTQCLNCRIMSGDLPLDDFEFSYGDGIKQKLHCTCKVPHYRSNIIVVFAISMGILLIDHFVSNY